MKRIFGYLCIASAMLCSVSCRQKQDSGRPTVKIVEDILNDPHSSEYVWLHSFDPSSPNGDIVVIDEPLRAVRFCEAFVTCDLCDNITGSEGGDMLPDFSGERISTILDISNVNYSSIVNEQGDSTMRNVTVAAFLSSIDTLCCVAPYDKEFSSKRNRAKITVLSSPYMDLFGKYDIDTLLHSTGSSFPVVFPVRIAYETLFDIAGGPFNVAVLPDSSVKSPQVYSAIFKEVADVHKDALSTCVAVKVDGGDDLLVRFLNLYQSAGMGGKLNYIILDDLSADIESLRASYEKIMTVQSEINLELRKVLTSDLVFVKTSDCAAGYCYRLFRKNNNFTHKIAYPKASAYITKNLPGTYELIDYEPSFLPEGLEDMLKPSAPKSFDLYVQN